VFTALTAICRADSAQKSNFIVNELGETTMLRYSMTAVLMMLAAVPGLAQATAWEIDSAHSGAHFSVRHMMIATVRGEFRKVTGTINLDEKDISKSSVEAVIDATTIDTREERRDTHLKSADFFDVSKFPSITFKSKSVTRQGEGKFKVAGDLTMHGVTKEVILDVEGLNAQVIDPRRGPKMGASATTRIKRSDFGLTWNRAVETGGVAVSDEVGIIIDLELAKKAPAAPAATGGSSK
jgi:polyisoprenoid-binding protein YceI